MSDLVHFLNGKFVSEEELLISPRDLGFVRGYAVTDFLVTYNHRLFKLSKHVDRLFKSAEVIGLQIPWSKEQIESWVIETLDKNDNDAEKSIKILISGGISHSMRQAEIPTIVIIVSNRIRKPESDYEKGIKVKVVQYKRPYPTAKTTHYIEGIKQLANAGEDISDVIYYDDSQVYEASGCSLFAVINNALVTAKSNVLEGITRNTLLEILKLPIPIEIKDFTFEELMSATEVFITGSNSEVRGVIEINGKAVGSGKVGKITKEVMKQYRKYILEIVNQK